MTTSPSLTFVSQLVETDSLWLLNYCALTIRPSERVEDDLMFLEKVSRIPSWFPAQEFYSAALTLTQSKSIDGPKRQNILKRILAFPNVDDTSRISLLRVLSVNEKADGDLNSCIKSLKAIAVLEGGLVVASSLTLLNLSACYLAQSKVAEAAAIAKQAVSRLGTGQQSPMIQAAAYHNLAISMEAAQDLEAADRAYRCAEDVAMVSLGDTHPTTMSIQRSYAGFLCRTHYTDASLQRKEWEVSTKEVLTTHTRMVLHESQNATSIKPAPRRKPVQLPPSVAVYHLPPLRAQKKATLVNNSFSPNTTASVLPEWNNDPVVGRSLRSLPKIATAGINWEVENDVSQRYIPKWLVPAMEDLIYKQATRRKTLEHDEAKARTSVLQILTLSKLCSHEKEARVFIEANEYRTRRQMISWTAGKAIFLEGRSKLEKELERFIQKITMEEEGSIAPLRFEIESTKLFDREPVARRSVLVEESVARSRLSKVYEKATQIFFSGLGLLNTDGTLMLSPTMSPPAGQFDGSLILDLRPTYMKFLENTRGSFTNYVIDVMFLNQN
eukprot:PhF_6_TR20507/c0_g1_i1/m.29561